MRTYTLCHRTKDRLYKGERKTWTSKNFYISYYEKRERKWIDTGFEDEEIRKRKIEFHAGYYEWHLIFDDEIVYVFSESIADFFTEGMTFIDCKKTAEWLLSISIEESSHNEDHRETRDNLGDIPLGKEELDYISTIIADRMYNQYVAA